MKNYNDENLLEMVELYAEEIGAISTEEALSERFDEQELPSIIENNGRVGKEFTDTVLVNECFNNWTDMLCKDQEIHPKQYDNYCYVGKYSN